MQQARGAQGTPDSLWIAGDSTRREQKLRGSTCLEGCKEQSCRHSTRKGEGLLQLSAKGEDGVADKGSVPQQGVVDLSVRMRTAGCEMPGGHNKEGTKSGG